MVLLLYSETGVALITHAECIIETWSTVRLTPAGLRLGWRLQAANHGNEIHLTSANEILLKNSMIQ